VTVTNIADAKKKKPRRPPKPWELGLIPNKDGVPKRVLANCLHVLSEHPAWQGVLAYDAFAQCVVTLERPPMREQDAPTEYTPGEFTEQDVSRTRAWTAREAGFEPTANDVQQAVAVIAERNISHPVKDWLASLAWDGTERLDRMLAQYFGAADSPYTCAVSSRWMISAVARTMQPGCKADSMLVLESPEQGIGKSSALRELAGPDWFADTGITIGEKDSYQALRRKWIYEFAELSAIRGRDVERVKNFVSSQCDNYRPSYGQRNRDYPRQCVFAGSTNQNHYLHDPTGSRRFWPVRCTHVDLASIRQDRDQLWAEAVARFTAGEPWHLDTAELRILAASEAEGREERDDWIDIVTKWLQAPTVPVTGSERERCVLDIGTDGVSTADVLLGALAFSPERINQASTTRAGHVLRHLQYEPRQFRLAGQRVRRYFAKGCDKGCDASEATTTPLSHVTPVTPTSIHTQERDADSGFYSPIGKPAVTAVTCDTPDGDDDIEREAIQTEGGVE
jgi:hypothetical protein